MRGATVFLKEEEIQSLVKNVAKKIDQAYLHIEEELYVVCPLKGSLLFFSDLIRELKTPVKIDFILIDGFKSGFSIIKDIDFQIKNRHVLIVKDVVNAGNKLVFLKKRLEANSPKSVEIATLLDKPSQRKMDLQVDFFGKKIEDRHVFGYGMDSNEYYRELRDIFNFAQ